MDASSLNTQSNLQPAVQQPVKKSLLPADYLNLVVGGMGSRYTARIEGLREDALKDGNAALVKGVLENNKGVMDKLASETNGNIGTMTWIQGNLIKEIKNTGVAIQEAKETKVRRLIISYVLAFLLVVAIVGAVASAVFSFGVAPLVVCIVAAAVLGICGAIRSYATSSDHVPGEPRSFQTDIELIGSLFLFLCRVIVSPILLVTTEHLLVNTLEKDLVNFKAACERRVQSHNACVESLKEKFNRVDESNSGQTRLQIALKDTNPNNSEAEVEAMKERVLFALEHLKLKES